MKKVTLPANFSEYNFALLAKKEKNAALKVRYLALSYIDAGKTVLESAALVYKSSRMVHRWITCLTESGLDGLQDKPGRGRKRHLSLDNEAEFKQLVLELQKSGRKITGRDIKQLLIEKYEIECTLPTVYNILNRLGLSISDASRGVKRKRAANSAQDSRKAA